MGEISAPNEGGYTGIWFDKKGKLKVWLVEGLTNEPYTTVYEGANDFFTKSLKFLDDDIKVKKAPKHSGLRNGWFTTELKFLALQESITSGATEAAQLSICLALAVLCLMTRRFITAACAALQILMCLGAVTGCFVLMGWKMGFIESLIFSVGVGLVVDFSAHLAHSFVKEDFRDPFLPRYFPTSSDELRVFSKDAKRRATAAMTELGTTITTGYITTFIPGLLLIGCRTFFFFQFGCFLSQIISFSYFSAFGLLMPVLAVVGWVDELMVAQLNEMLEQCGIMERWAWLWAGCGLCSRTAPGEDKADTSDDSPNGRISQKLPEDLFVSDFPTARSFAPSISKGTALSTTLSPMQSQQQQQQQQQGRPVSEREKKKANLKGTRRDRANRAKEVRGPKDKEDKKDRKHRRNRGDDRDKDKKRKKKKKKEEEQGQEEIKSERGSATGTSLSAKMKKYRG